MAKKKIPKYLLLLIILSLLPMMAVVLPSKLLHTHDGLVHLPRMAAWFKALKAGQFPPRWAADLNYGYGTPVLIFMYPWPYFLSAIFLFLGASLVWSFKLVVFLSFLLSAVFMFLFAKAFLKDEKKAFLVALFYQFASFHLIEVLTRGALGEMWTYAFLPLALLGLTKVFNKKIFTGVLVASLGTGLLILTHNSVSLAFFACLVLFVLVFGKNLKSRLWGFASLFWGLALAAFYFLPALWERKYTYGDLFMRELYLQHFPGLKKLFLPNFLNQPFGQVHHLSVQIGFFHLLAVLLVGFFLFKKKLKGIEKEIALFSLLIFAVALFFMQPISIPAWRKFALLRQFQFSWRLLSLTIFASSLAAISFFKIKILGQKNFFWLLVLLIFFSSLAFWRPPEGYDKINEQDFWNYPLNTTYFGEADTIWAASPPTQYPEKRIEVIGGEGEIRDLEKRSTFHQFKVVAKTQVNLVDKTLFFPGWRVFADDKMVEVQFQDPNNRGLITFQLPPGEHQVRVVFDKTKDRVVAETVSLLGFLGWLFLAMKLTYNKIK